MARTRTLALLRDDVADRGDIVIDSTGRWSSTRVNRYINQAIQRFVAMVTSAGHEHYLRRATLTTSASTSEDANGWQPCEYVAAPSDLVKIHAMQISFSGRAELMAEVETAEGLAVQDAALWLSTDQPGIPRFYRLGGLAKPGGVNTDAIRIFPKANGVYSIECWYLPALTDLAADGDTFDGIFGAEEWVVNRAAMDVLIRGGLTTGPVYGALAAENAKLEQEIRFQMATKGGPGRRQNTGALRRALP